MANPYCGICGGYRHSRHQCPPTWMVTYDNNEREIYADDAEEAARKYIEEMDDKGDSVGPYIVTVTALDGTESTWTVEGEVEVNWRAWEVTGA